MEDYEKKYKEALAKAREIHRNEAEKRFDMEWLFPELKESEDERVKKRILLSLEKDLMAIKNSGCGTQDLEQCIAWLEKQGYTKKDVDDAYLKGICDAKHELEKQGEQKPAVVDFNAKDWYVSKVDGKLHNIYQSVDKIEQKPTSDTRYEVKAGDSLSVNGKPFDHEHATITQKDFASVGETATIELSSPIDCGDRIYHVSHKPIKKNGEQKPTEWSEEDENYLQSAENACEYQYGKNTSTILWLKSLKDRVQPKQEWSDEDEEKLQSCTGAIWAADYYLYEDKQEMEVWLKSLKDRIGR